MTFNIPFSAQPPYNPNSTELFNHEMSKQVNREKFTPILLAYRKGKFPGVSETDLREILKYI